MCGDLAGAAVADDGVMLGDLGLGDLGNLGGGKPAAADEPPALLDDLLFGAGEPPAPAAAPRAVAGGPSGLGQPGLDLFLGNLPSADSSPLAPLELDLGGNAAATADGPAAAFDPLGAPPPDAPPLDLALPGAAADPAASGADPLDIGAMFASLLPGGPPKGGTQTIPSPFQGAPQEPAANPPSVLGADLVPDLGLGDAPPAPPAPTAAAPGWSLTLTPPPVSPDVRPEPESYKAPRLPATPGGQSGTRKAVAGGGSIPSGVPRLEPPRKKGETLVAQVEAPRRRKLPIIGAAAGVVLAAGVAALVLGRGGSTDDLAAVLAPFETDLARDHYPSYAKAAEAIMASEDAAASSSKRAAAAELLLLASLGRGAERAKLAKANELLTDLKLGAEPPAVIGRARALAAVARNRGSEVDGHLGSITGAEAALIKGVRRLRERRAAEAINQLRAVVAGAPERVIGHYLLARALEDAGKREDAKQLYRKVLEKNPTHAGAAVGLERTSAATPAERQKSAEALAQKIATTASPSELGEAQTLQGESMLALGQATPALDLLSRAVIANPGDARAQAALTEAMLAEGKATEALARLRALEPAVLSTPLGRLALGAALVAAGQIAEGSGLLDAAAPELPTDPRVATWQAVAAESKRPPDDALATRRLREALKIDARYLPAALRLAALLQRQGKANDALALIKEAEAAGAPAEALSVAWGQALVEAKNPAQAEIVLRKAIEKSPQLVGARTALAAALEAAGKQAEAEEELSRAIVELPKATGLRERLAALYAKHGKPEEALATLEKERAAGKPSSGLKVQIAKLALELGQPQRAISELEQLVTDDPSVPEGLFTLGRAREASGDSSRALGDYRRALAFESSPALNLAYGRALAGTGRDEEALAALEVAGDLAAARLERARIRLKRNEVDEALKEAESAARLAPQEARAHFLTGICLDLMGRADEAAAAWRKAIAASSDYAEAHYRLGRYEMDKGRQPTALAHFRNAAAKPLGKVNWEADLYFQLGFAEVAAGSRTQAVTALRKYLELSANDAPARPEAERLLARLNRN